MKTVAIVFAAVLLSAFTYFMWTAAAANKQLIKERDVAMQETEAVFKQLKECQAKHDAQEKAKHAAEHSEVMKKAKDLGRSIRCMTAQLRYSNDVEKHAGLPRAWLQANVFGDRRDPNYKAFNDLPKHKMEKLLEALQMYQHPGKDCENINLERPE